MTVRVWINNVSYEISEVSDINRIQMTKDFKTQEKNLIELWNMVQLVKLKKYLSTETNLGKIDIRIVGHSNNIDIGDKSIFKSNAELAESRASMVPIFLHNKLASELSMWQTITYIKSNTASENSFFHSKLEMLNESEDESTFKQDQLECSKKYHWPIIKTDNEYSLDFFRSSEVIITKHNDLAKKYMTLQNGRML